MKVRSSAILGLLCFGSILAMDVRLDCKDIAISGLMDAMWYSAAVATSEQMIQDNQAAQGQPGAPGADGINCWDLNGNGQNDPEEDINGDGEFNALDCQGPPGEDGQAGQGQPGADGADGLNCWDLDGDGVQDPAEDVNGDGVWDALDCQGADGRDGIDGQDGADGADGEDGLNCWDLDGDGVQDPAEDVNGDGVWDALDCRGADGQDLTGLIARAVIPGADIPDPNDGDWVPAAGTATGILRVYRPANPPGAPPTRGRYRIVVDLPDRATDYQQAEIIALVSVQALHTDGGPPGSGGATAQAFGYWEVVSIDNAADEVEFEVMIRTAPLNFFTDASFSFIVLLP